MRCDYGHYERQIACAQLLDATGGKCPTTNEINWATNASVDHERTQCNGSMTVGQLFVGSIGLQWLPLIATVAKPKRESVVCAKFEPSGSFSCFLLASIDLGGSYKCSIRMCVHTMCEKVKQ